MKLPDEVDLPDDGQGVRAFDADELNLAIGRRARFVREALGLSQAEAAERFGAAGFPMSHVNLLNLEKGRVRWNVHHLAALGRAYGVDPAALFITPQEQGLLTMWRVAREQGVLLWLSKLFNQGE